MGETYLEFMIRREKEKEKRPRVLPEPLPIYEHKESRIPDRIRVSFGDGSTAVYDLHTEMPHPLVLKNIEIMEQTERNIKQGYVNRTERRRRRK